MYGKIKEFLQKELADIKEAGLYKEERIITSPQRAEIEVGDKKVLNFCANNYLGLSDNPRLVEAAKKAMEKRPRKPWTHAATACRPYVSSAVRRIYIRNSRLPSPITSVLKTQSSTRLASMPMEVCSSRC